MWAAINFSCLYDLLLKYRLKADSLLCDELLTAMIDMNNVVVDYSKL
jgi:hypothetical protein